MIDDHRGMVTEHAICQAVHQPVAERIELLPIGLRNASPAVAGLRERGDRNVGSGGQRAGRRHGREIRAQLIETQTAGGFEIQEIAGRPVGQRHRTVEIGRQEIAVIRDREAHRCGRACAIHHRVAVVGAELRAGEGLGVQEHIVGGEIGRVARGRPHPEFRIIVQRGAEIVGIETIGAARVIGLRHADAFRIGRAAGAA